MKYDKTFLRNKFLLKRKKEYLRVKKFNFKLIFNLIKRNFKNKKIIIAGYYPANYEVNVLKFLEQAQKKRYKIALPAIDTSSKMSFKLWNFNHPLYINKFGILEPDRLNQKLKPDLILVPLVAFDKNLNRIGYGKGYYDRNLRKIKKTKKKIVSLGIAYSFQKSEVIPVNKYDFKLDYIFTEQGIISSNY